MTVFARSDVDLVQHPETGETFERSFKKQGRGKDAVKDYDRESPFAITADPAFEAHLLEMFPDQFSSNEARIPLTPDQIADKELLEKEGTIVTGQMAAALAQAAAQLVAGNAAA